jgi:hypothetical protein
MPINSVRKGRALEDAVGFIQDAVLRSDPTFKGIEFTIDTRQTVKVKNVSYEVDVLVKTLLRTQLEATWIFECKNWARPVGRKEIQDLSTRVNALGATKGFIVAKSLSKNAYAQLEQEMRLEFIRCREDFWSPLNSTELIHTTHDLLPIGVLIKERGVPTIPSPARLDFRNLNCSLNGKTIDFVHYVHTQMDQMIAEDRNQHLSQYFFEGNHWGESTGLLKYSLGELMIDAMDVEYITIPLRFFITIRKRRIVSKFELEARGRAFNFEPIEGIIPGKRLEISMVQRI